MLAVPYPPTNCELKIMSEHAEAQQAAALIQNWSNHHWVAYRWGNDGEIYRLDSMQLGPNKVSEAEFAASMVAHWTYAVKRPGEGP